MHERIDSDAVPAVAVESTRLQCTMVITGNGKAGVRRRIFGGQ